MRLRLHYFKIRNITTLFYILLCILYIELYVSGGSGFMPGQYYQEIRNFQEILGLVMAESGTSHIISE